MKYLIEVKGRDFNVTADIEVVERYKARGQLAGEKVITYDYLDGYDIEALQVHSIEWSNANTITEEVTYSKYPRLYDEIIARLEEQIESQISI
jgi:hypothetical protein